MSDNSGLWLGLGLAALGVAGAVYLVGQQKPQTAPPVGCTPACVAPQICANGVCHTPVVIPPPVTGCTPKCPNPQVCVGATCHDPVAFPPTQVVLGDPFVPNLPAGPVTVQYGSPFTIHNPKIKYQGPATTVWTYMRLEQIIDGFPVSVYGSGLAQINLPASATPTDFSLIPSDESQLGGGQAADLTAIPWPGPDSMPLNGGHPLIGLASVYLDVFHDGLGLQNPTYSGRQPTAELQLPVYVNLFVTPAGY